MQILIKGKELEETLVGHHYSISPSGSGGVGNPNLGGIQVRLVKLDFPKFNGTNPSGWLYKTV